MTEQVEDNMVDVEAIEVEETKDLTKVEVVVVHVSPDYSLIGILGEEPEDVNDAGNNFYIIHPYRVTHKKNLKKYENYSDDDYLIINPAMVFSISRPRNELIEEYLKVSGLKD